MHIFATDSERVGKEKNHIFENMTKSELVNDEKIPKVFFVVGNLYIFFATDIANELGCLFHIKDDSYWIDSLEFFYIKQKI